MEPRRCVGAVLVVHASLDTSIRIQLMTVVVGVVVVFVVTLVFV